MQTKLKKWVDDFGGVPAVARALDVTEHQVRNWLRGEQTPRAKRLNEIIRLSKGTLSFEIIFKETSRCKKKVAV